MANFCFYTRRKGLLVGDLDVSPVPLTSRPPTLFSVSLLLESHFFTFISSFSHRAPPCPPLCKGPYNFDTISLLSQPFFFFLSWGCHPTHGMAPFSPSNTQKMIAPPGRSSLNPRFCPFPHFSVFHFLNLPVFSRSKARDGKTLVSARSSHFLLRAPKDSLDGWTLVLTRVLP